MATSNEKPPAAQQAEQHGAYGTAIEVENRHPSRREGSE